MNRIYIEKLSVTGTKTPSHIEFGKNLTIIAGPSDTGKSYIYKCIDYLFGANNKNKPFDPSIGYDTISMKLMKDDNYVVITRKIGRNILSVESTIDGIESRSDYSIKPDAVHSINHVYCALLGLPKDYTVPFNDRGEEKRFTWRTFKCCVMVHEDHTEMEGPILLPKKTDISKTFFYSHLLKVLYDQDFSAYSANPDEKNKAIRKSALQKYILSQRDKIKIRTEELNILLNDIGDAQTNLDEAINDLSTELEKLENDINTALNDNREVAGDILVIQDKINGLTMRLNRYEELESQYTADIKRLTFIVDNESIEENGNQEYKCPFCDSHVEGHDHTTYLEASRSELNRIVKYLDDLGTSKQELQNEINSLKNELAELKKEKEEINNLIYKELIPQKKEIKQKLINYQRAIELQNELEIIKKYDTIFDDDLKNLESKVDERRPYKPLQLLLEDFPIKVAENFKEIMTEIHYNPIGDSEFKLDEFEIYFNGQVKRDHGKGYRALFNSVLILALRKYINDLDTPTPHNPHFYFIDSPLHGLMLRSGIEDSLNVRKGFFEYLANHCEGDQIIVIENTDEHELPEIPENENIKVYQFTEDENNGRYGFLEGIRRN